jgi:hypothetical protein
MSQDQRPERVGELAVYDVQIRSADRACPDRDQQLAVTGGRWRNIGRP